MDECLFVGSKSIDGRKVECDGGAVSGSHFRVNHSCSQRLARFIHDFITYIISRAGQECHLVLHEECVPPVLHSLELQWLIDFLRVIAFRRPTPVWTHQTVDAEISVVRIVAKVATVCPIFLSRRTLREQALVLEVPDELTGQAGILLIEVEHVAHITHRIAHRVAVFALDVRLLVALPLTR